MGTADSAVQSDDTSGLRIVTREGSVYGSRAPAQLTPPSNKLGVSEPSHRAAPGEISKSTAPPLERPADVAVLVEKVTTVADRIEDAFSVRASDDLRGRVESWTELHGFDEFDESVRMRCIARQAAIAVLLRVTLYESRHECELRPATAEERLRNAASGETSGVDWSVIDDIAWLADDVDLAPVINGSQELLQSTAPSADLGELYARSVDTAARQTLSQFRTPRWAGRAMRTWTVSDGETLVDAGIGPGALSTPLHPSWQLHPEPRHVVGIDRSSLSLLLGDTALTLSNQPHSVVETDFLDTDPADLPASPDGMVVNPPFTSTDRLDDADKDRWGRHVRQAVDVDINRQAPLYVYFMLHAGTLLDEGCRVTFLTPQAWLQKQYGQELKQFLKNQFDIKALIRVDPEHGSLFPDADTTAVFTLLEVQNNPDPTSETRFITIDDTEFDTLQRAMCNAVTEDTDWAMVNTVEQSALTNTENWQARFDPGETDVSHLPILAHVASVSVPRPTGSNALFCLTEETRRKYGISKQHVTRLLRRPRQVSGYAYDEDDWLAARDAGKEVWLLDPEEIPAMPDTAAEFAQQYETGEFTVDDVVRAESTKLQQADDGTLETTTTERAYENLFEYLYDGIVEHGLRDCTTFQQRSLWYRPQRREMADSAAVVVDTGFYDKPRFMLNEAELRPTNTFFAVRISLTGVNKKALLAYLNSNFVGKVARQDSGCRSTGMNKLSTTVTEELPIIDPRTLPDSEVRALADAFDDLCDLEPDDSDGEAIDRIDTIVNRAVERSRPL